MQKPIILHITTSLMIGGAEKLLCDLLTNFQNHPQNQFEHQVIYFQTGPYLQVLEKLKIKTYHVQGLTNHYDPFCWWRLLNLVKKISPKKMHAMLWTANFYTRIIGKILKIPTICAIHSQHNSGNFTKDNIIKHLLDKFTLRWACKIVVVSQDIQKKFAQPIYKLNQDQLTLINNGVILPANLKKRLKNQPFTIGHVGRFVPVKNQHLLVMALNIIRFKIPDFKAIIIGHGPLELTIKQMVAKLDLLAHVDFIKTNQPDQYFSSFDCFVQPSHTEGQSIALLQAMSWEVAPIITQKNQKHDIIQHLHNGLICPANDALGLSQAILNLYKNPQLKKILAQSARQTIENNFNLMQTASKYLTLY